MKVRNYCDDGGRTDRNPSEPVWKSSQDATPWAQGLGRKEGRPFLSERSWEAQMETWQPPANIKGHGRDSRRGWPGGGGHRIAETQKRPAG